MGPFFVVVGVDVVRGKEKMRGKTSKLGWKMIGNRNADRGDHPGIGLCARTFL